MSEALAWAAGLFDGEGSFSSHRAYNGNYYPHASIGQAHREVLDRFMLSVGLGKVYGPYAPTGLSKKQWWQYHCSGALGVHSLLERLRPWLGTIKTNDGDRVLRQYLENQDRRRIYTVEQRSEMLHRLRLGERVIDIARATGITAKSVSYHKNKAVKMLDKDSAADVESAEAAGVGL